MKFVPMSIFIVFSLAFILLGVYLINPEAIKEALGVFCFVLGYSTLIISLVYLIPKE